MFHPHKFRLRFLPPIAIVLTVLFLFRAQLKINNVVDVCPKDSPYLVGWTNVSAESKVLSVSEWEYFQKRYQGVVQPGGRYRPRDCTARYKVVIIVPCSRDRKDHFRKFLIHMHPFLQRQHQLLDYSIFAIQQAGTGTFNKAQLLNAGAVEALKMDPTLDCFIFHDVDLLPEDDRNLYTCPEGNPIHMSVAVSLYGYQLLNLDLFGGVVVMTPDQFNLVNAATPTSSGAGAARTTTCSTGSFVPDWHLSSAHRVQWHGTRCHIIGGTQSTSIQSGMNYF